MNLLTTETDEQLATAPGQTTIARRGPMTIDNYTDRERELRCAVADLQAENKALQDMLAQQAAMVEKCMVAMNENADRGEKAEAKLAALEKQEPIAWKWEVLPGAPIAKYQVEKAGVYFEDPAKIGIDINCERSVANYKWTLLYAAAGAAPAPMELVLTFNFGTLVKAEFQDRILYEVDLSPKSYFEVCWAHGWAGDYETEEDAENECLSLCGYSRSIREVKPEDDGYKNPRQPQLTEKRFLLTAAGAASVPEGWQLVPVEPTQEMLDAADHGRYSGGLWAQYRNMLAAAPKEQP